MLGVRGRTRPDFRSPETGLYSNLEKYEVSISSNTVHVAIADRYFFIKATIVRSCPVSQGLHSSADKYLNDSLQS